MRYYDVTMETEAITLLTKIGNTLAKVPLDDYSILFEYLETNNIMSNVDSTSIILPNIQLAQTMNAQELLNPQNPRVSFSSPNPPGPPSSPTAVAGGNPLGPPNGPRVAVAGVNPPIPFYSHLEKDENTIYRFDEYVPLADNGTGKSRGGAFASSSVVIEPYTADETYVFSKAPSFADKDQGIQDDIRSLPSNKFGIYKYKFSVDVEEGTTARVLSVDNEGQVRQQLVLLIPGIHEYTITYAPCKYREDYIASIYANTMLIKAIWPEYRDLHDRDIAFHDGCRRNLPIEFYNADGRRLDDGEKHHNQRRG